MQKNTDPLDPHSFPGKLYVHAKAAGNATGTSWANAYTNLRDALAVAGTGVEIWVAAGAYKPDQGKGATPGDRSATFRLQPDVAVYGGFAGTETTLAQRDWRKNTTLLSGDLLGNDQPGRVNNAENSIHVVTFTSTLPASNPATATLDGFTISHGYARDMYDDGGGVYLEYTNAVIRNCIISDSDGFDGGGVSVYNANLTLEDSILRGNFANYGGGVHIMNGNTTIARCLIEGNTTHYDGAGIADLGNNTVIANSIIRYNYSGYYGGGILFRSSDNSLLINSTVVNNDASSASGLSQSGAKDNDSDGMTNLMEYQAGTSPLSADTDNDGATDVAETQAGTDPAHPLSRPVRLFVKANATGSGTGVSWADAYTSLQGALTAAWSGSEIWVAAGAYRPDQGKGITPGDRNASFALKPGVSVFGGFKGGETDLGQRDWNTFKTILSGDLKGDDVPSFTKYEDNSLHVVSLYKRPHVGRPGS